MRRIDDKIFTNADVSPWFAISPNTHQTLTNVKNLLAANVAVIKDYVKTNRPQFRNSVLDEYR